MPCHTIYDLGASGFRWSGLLGVAVPLLGLVLLLTTRQVTDRKGRVLPPSTRWFFIVWAGLFLVITSVCEALSYAHYRSDLAELRGRHAHFVDALVHDHRRVGHSNDEVFSVGNVNVEMTGVLGGYGMRDGSLVREGQHAHLYYSRWGHSLNGPASPSGLVLHMEICTE